MAAVVARLVEAVEILHRDEQPAEVFQIGEDLVDLSLAPELLNEKLG